MCNNVNLCRGSLPFTNAVPHKDTAMLWSRTMNVPAACSADREPEGEGGGEMERREGRPIKQREEEGGEGPPLSSIAVLREPTKGTFPHTHHSRPANQSARILDPSSLVQLLIHGSAKQM